MAHYALLDENNTVISVFVGKDETDTDNLPDEFSSWEKYYENINDFTCKRTSYNTNSGQHILGGTAFRGNYAGIGFTYDEVNDVFLPVKEYNSWILNTEKWLWEAPIPYPDDNNYYDWNEQTQSWDLQE
tara:strand:+ start:60 stop:446 length:387 start_codon:yes stop_codon:yes gene_type:complete